MIEINSFMIGGFAGILVGATLGVTITLWLFVTKEEKEFD